MANKTKDPVVQVRFGGEDRMIRWDYNTVAELQDLGYDFTDAEFVKTLTAKATPSLKMLRAMATAALISGADDGRVFTANEVGRIVTAEGEKSEIFSAVSELMRLAHGEEEQPDPLAETAAPA